MPEQKDQRVLEFSLEKQPTASQPVESVDAEAAAAPPVAVNAEHSVAQESAVIPADVKSESDSAVAATSLASLAARVSHGSLAALVQPNQQVSTDAPGVQQVSQGLEEPVISAAPSALPNGSVVQSATSNPPDVQNLTPEPKAQSAHVAAIPPVINSRRQARIVAEPQTAPIAPTIPLPAFVLDEQSLLNVPDAPAELMQQAAPSPAAAATVPNSQSVSSAQSIPNPQSVSSAQSIPNPQSESSTQSIPNPQSESSAQSVPNPQSESSAQNVPKPPGVADPQSVSGPNNDSSSHASTMPLPAFVLDEQSLLSAPAAAIPANAPASPAASVSANMSPSGVNALAPPSAPIPPNISLDNPPNNPASVLISANVSASRAVSSMPGSAGASIPSNVQSAWSAQVPPAASATPAAAKAQRAEVAKTMPELSSHPNLSGSLSLDKERELVGRRVAGRYVLEEFLGSGGMSIVYRATEKRASRSVAIKLMHQQTDVNTKVLERFQQEGKALSQLDHRNIVKVYEYGMHEGSLPFMVMEYVKGVTLSYMLASEHKLSSQESVDIIMQMCAALAHAHSLRVVHRDLKPSNVMITTDELGNRHIKLVDFGIAKVAAETNMQLTNTGDIFGSPLYMSPEQCNGWPVDQRTDLYSLGCVLYECLTGSPPFVGETPMATMLMHQHEQPPTLKEGTLGYEFPQRLEQIVARMLQKDRDSRYQTAREVSADLEQLRVSGLMSAESVPSARPGKTNLDVLRSLRGHCADRFGITKEVADAWRVTKAPDSGPSVKSLLATFSLALVLIFPVIFCIGFANVMNWFRVPAPQSQDSSNRQQVDKGTESDVNPPLDQTQGDKGAVAHAPVSVSVSAPVPVPTVTDQPASTHMTPTAGSEDSSTVVFDKSRGLALDVGEYYPHNLSKMPKKLSSVEEVRFPYGMRLGPDEFRQLSKLPARSIDLKGCLIGSGLRQIRGNTSLLSLDLSDTNVSSLDIVDLNPRLRELSLSDCLIDDGIVEELLRLRNLRNLSLARTIVTDKCMPYLLKMNLERLDIRETKITPEKIKVFLQQKPECVVILH